MFFHHLSHLHVTTLLQSHSAAGFIASSTELHRTSSSTPLCTHQDVNTPLRFGEGRSPSPTVLSWGHCVALGQFVLSPRSRGQLKLLVTACVQTPCSSPLGWGQLVQYKCFPGGWCLNIFVVVVLETLPSCGCNIVWCPNPVPCWNCVTALCWAALVSSGDLVNGQYWDGFVNTWASFLLCSFCTCRNVLVYSTTHFSRRRSPLVTVVWFSGK